MRPSFMDFSEDRVLAQGHGRRRTAERHDVELDAREDKIYARRDPRAYGAQLYGSDVMVDEDTGLVEGNAGLAHEDATLGLQPLIGRQNNKADRGARRDAAVKFGRQDAEVHRSGLR